MRTRLLWIVLWATLAGGCAPISDLSVKNVHVATPGVLVRGGQADAMGLFALKRTFNIRTVVNFNDATATSEAATARALGLDYLAVPSSPFNAEPAKILAFLKVVQDAGAHAPVYVHCRDGMDRTGYAVAAYRIVLQDWSADRAMDDLHAHQQFLHTVAFQNIPFFVRGVAAHKAEWRARLAATPDPLTEPPQIVSLPSSNPSAASRSSTPR